MAVIVGVRFSRSGRVHYFDASQLVVNEGDQVEVETDDGPRQATAIIGSGQVAHSDLRGPLPKLLGVISPANRHSGEGRNPEE